MGMCMQSRKCLRRPTLETTASAPHVREVDGVARLCEAGNLAERFLGPLTRNSKVSKGHQPLPQNRSQAYCQDTASADAASLPMR